ncbi:MAG: carbohydrate-binding protein [Paludibacteraceae bacterium]|nr:carbohydrate-binding protein [Paludibacteraceae bacterium]
MKNNTNYNMKNANKKLLGMLIALLSFTTGAFADPDPNFHIYLCFGQSNMEGNATVPASEKTGVDERFQMIYTANNCSNGDRKLGQWYTATPPLARCFHWNNAGFGPVDYFGRTLVEKLDKQIKVGVVVVACGGADIQLFEKDRYKDYLSTCADWLKGYANDYGGNPYGRLVEMGKQAQQKGVIKGILVHQGETNNGQSDWPKRLNGVYTNLLNDLGLKASEVPLLVGEVRYTGPCRGHNNVIRNVPNVIPTAHVVSAEGCEAANDDFHFTVDGYKLLGKRYAEKMLELLGDNPVQQAGLTLSSIVNAESEPGEVQLAVNCENENIKKIEIYADGKMISSGNASTTTPLAYTWKNVERGKHSVWAVGYDANNKEYSTSKQEVVIFMPQTPFNGKPFAIPGKIEAEEFDLGGEGNAYHDSDEQNRNGGDRNEGVDMSNTAVGYTQVGEWLEYTVDVAEDGDYIVESRVASGSDGSAFTLYMDNNFIIPGADGTPGGFVKVPNTGDWSEYTTVKTKLNKLTKGTHVLKLEITGDWVDIDYLNFKLASDDKGGDIDIPAEQEVLTNITTGTYVDFKVNNRGVTMYAPKGIHANRPLLISCHGMNQDAKYQREQTRWDQVADTADFIVVFPWANGSTWDIGGKTDTDFLVAIINYMVKTYKVDATRVYMSGFSMGGMLTYHCMNMIPDYFAAFAPVSGYQFGGNPSASTRAIPIFHTHGTSDDVVHFEPYQNQEGIEAVINKWQKHNKCAGKTTSKVNNCATRTAYTDGECDADVVLNAIPNKGHWHSNDEACFHTSREIWRFVSQYTTACGKQAGLSVSATATEDVAPGVVKVTVSTRGEISDIKIYADKKQIGTGTSCTWTDVESGKHSIYAEGTNANGEKVQSGEAIVSINVPQGPFNGVATKLPGTIEAEEFDLGGEGYAYHDNDPENRNGKTREEGVDMSATAVGYCEKGEWMEYTINITAAGEYDIAVYMGGDNGTGAVQLYLDDEKLGDEFVSNNTGDYSIFEPVSQKVSIKATGEHVLKMEITSSWVDIDKIVFSSKASGIDNIAADTDIVKTEYFNLAGQRVSEPVNGAFIKRDVYSSGNIIFTKMFK